MKEQVGLVLVKIKKLVKNSHSQIRAQLSESIGAQDNGTFQFPKQDFSLQNATDGTWSTEGQGSLTLQMTSRCLLLANELSCRQRSTSSCQCLHFTSNSVSVCVPPG